MMQFEKICTLEYGASLPKKKRIDGHIPVMGSNGISGYHNEYLIKGPAIIVGRKGSAGEVTYINSDCFPIDTTYYVKIVDTNRTDILYLYHLLKTLDLPSLRGGAGIPGLNRKDVYDKYKLPLPPLEVQREIVAEIEGYQRVIDGARAVIDNYRPQIVVDPEWPMEELGKVCDVRDGTHESPEYVPEGYPLITSKNLKNGYIDFGDVNLIRREDLDSINKRSKVDVGDILMPMIGTIGYPIIADTSREYAIKNIALIKFKKDSKIKTRFLKHVLASAEMQTRFEQQAGGSTQKFLSLRFLRSLSIPIPSLSIQQAIIAEIEAEQSLVAANRELVERMEGKIRAAIGRVWGTSNQI